MPLRKALWILFLTFQCGCASLNKSAPAADAKACVRTPARVYSEAPEPIVVVSGNHIYADPQNSLIDKDLYERNEAARKPLRNYLDQIIKMTEYANQGDGDAGRAVNAWLLNWADGDALTKVDSQQAGFERKWLLSGLLISYLNNKLYSGWKQQVKIETWLARLTHAMMEEYQSYQKNSQRNNHVYWAGLVAIEMSLINNDKELLNWGLEKIRFGLAQIDSEGFLPLELERKGKALQYHRVSLDALVMAAYLLKDRGVNLLKEHDGALERLAEKTLDGFVNPEIFAAKTGNKQEFNLKDSTAWVLIYSQLKPENVKAKNILKTAPANWNRTLGGRPTELFERSHGGLLRCEGIL